MDDQEKKKAGWRECAAIKRLAAVARHPIPAGLAVVAIPAAIVAISSNGPSAALEGMDPVVHNGPVEYERAPGSDPRLLASRQTDKSKARVEFRLKNDGERSAYITAATFTIRKLVHVMPCGAGGGVLLSGHYEIEMPRDAVEGQTIETPIDRHVPADGVDRFEFRIGREHAAEDSAHTFVYQLDIGVRYDDVDDPVEVGRILVALPGTPSMHVLGLSLPPSSVYGCIEDTVESFREAGELDGARSPAFERLLAAAQG